MKTQQASQADQTVHPQQTSRSKTWRPPSLTELDLKATETGLGPITDATDTSAS
ncbi:MAG: hypothetical protein GXP42_00590 [Chloroflexi bacterium]|nr:hypothetical protein [Chloroflexota bacterium]